MLIKKTTAGLATGAALALFMSASAAQAAPGWVVTAAPNPSVAGETVTLSSNFGPACSGATVEFRDITGGADKTLCGSSVDGTGAVTCVTNVLNETGPRTVRGVVFVGVGLCSAGTTSDTTSHTVNAAATAVPTVGEWTLWGLAGLLLISGGAVASRRFKVARGM